MKNFECYVCHNVAHIGFFFPVDEDKRQRWCEILEINSDRATSADKICSDHFFESDVLAPTKPKGKIHLRKNALPKPPPKPLQNQSIPIELSDVIPNLISESSPKQLQNDLNVSFPNTHSSTQVENTVISSVHNYDTPETPRIKRISRPLHQRYLGDFCSPHMKSPRLARRFFYLAKHENKIKREKIHKLQKKNLQLKKKIKSMEDLLHHLHQSNLISGAAYNQLLSTTPSDVRSLLDVMLMGEKPRVYNESIRKFAITLYFYSKDGYAFVRKLWKNLLPAESTIQKWLKVVGADPGFTAEAFETLKSYTENKKSSLAVNLIVDEISIRERISMSNDGKVFGIVDLGSNITIEADTDDLQKAKNALVFLAVSLREKLKVPLGYFLIDSLTGKERAHLVTICLNLLHEVNTHVISLTFDGAIVNLTMCRELGANLNYTTPEFQPYFRHPASNNPIFVYLDPSHMIKNVRNALAEFGPLKDDNNEEINWKNIINLYEHQKKLGIHYANKIKRKHIDFWNCKMKVKLATQVFSESIFHALNQLKEDGIEGFEKSSPTANFCWKFDQAFDMLNCREMNAYNEKCKPLKVPITNENFDTLKNKAEELERYIANLKSSDGTLLIHTARKTGFIGFIICLRNVFEIFKSLKKIPNFEFNYLLTFKLSQDHLENFFSAIRHKNGWNNNPDAQQFKGAYRQLLTHHQIQGFSGGNCLKDDVPILSVSSRPKKTKLAPETSTPASSQITPDLEDELAAYDSGSDVLNYESDISISDFENDIEVETIYNPDKSVDVGLRTVVSHIAGFLVRGILKKNECHECDEAICSKTPHTGLTEKKSHGGLIHASSSVINLCLCTEMSFRNNVKQLFNIGFNEAVKSEISINSICNIGCQNHSEKLANVIVEKYIKLRKYQEFSNLNDESKTTFIRQKYTKLIHFKHQ